MDNLPPMCETGFVTSRQFVPSVADFEVLQKSRVVLEWKTREQIRFDAWLCSLRSISDPETLDPKDLAQTIAKTIFFWIEAIFRARPVRPTLTPKEILSLQFVPHPDQLPPSLGRSPPNGCGLPTDWLRADVCRIQRNQTVAGADFAEAMGSRADTTRALWISGQLMRNAVDAVGPCAQLAARQLMRNARVVAPRSTSGSTSRYVSKHLAIGMHVRRGDACMRWAHVGDGDTSKSRPCYHLSDYIDAARQMAATYGARQLLVATDSDSVISELEAFTLESGEFTMVYLPYHRSMLFGTENRNMNLSIAEAEERGGFIEHQRFNQEGKALVFATFFAELNMLLKADMFIGTSASIVSRSVFLAQIGYHGHVPPYVFLDAPFGPVFEI
eukprot:6189243-Pleurochrysis_carterae.AAC.1